MVSEGWCPNAQLPVLVVTTPNRTAKLLRTAGGMLRGAARTAAACRTVGSAGVSLSGTASARPVHRQQQRSMASAKSARRRRQRTLHVAHRQGRDVATSADRVHELPAPVVAVLAQTVQPDHRGPVSRRATARWFNCLDVLEHIGGLVVRLLLDHARTA